MTTLEIGQKLVELCNQGKTRQVMDSLYSQDIVSVEAQALPDVPAEMHGLKACFGKSQWWEENHTIHAVKAEGPYPKGDRFIVKFHFDVTNKPSGRRYQMDEMALYTVQNGKIAREEFFYLTS